MLVQSPRILVDKLLPLTPFFIGTILGIRVLNNQLLINFFVASSLLVLITLNCTVLVRAQKSLLHKLHQGQSWKSYILNGVIYLILIATLLILFGLIRLRTTQGAFTITVIWSLLLLVYKYFYIIKVGKFSFLLRTFLNTLLALLGFLFAGINLSLPVVMASFAYASTFTAYQIIKQVESQDQKASIALNRVLAIGLVVGPGLITIMAALGYLSSSYTILIVSIVLIMPILENLCDPESSITREIVEQSQSYLILFLALLLVLETANQL